MHRPLRLLSIATAAALAACATSESPDNASDGSWVGTISTEGNVTTVVNESGSVWGGTATLVEEASIGVDVGAPEYMLGRIVSVAASGDRIYVLDRRPPVLRVYDLEGTHIMNIGRSGQGPGEFGSPASVAIAQDGTVFVRDNGNARFNVFGSDGALLDTWPTDGSASTSRETVITADGTPYAPFPVLLDAATRQRVIAFVPYGPEGALADPLMPPEFEYQQPRLRSGTQSGPVPYFPSPSAVLSPLGAWVSGIGDSYEIEVRYLDGRTIRIVRDVPPVPVSSDETAWTERAETAYWKSEDPSWTWSGPGVPNRKPFFDDLYADADGRIWVTRSGPSTRVADCDENPETYVRCWENTVFTEVFDADGRFLGGVAPFGFQRNFMRGDLVVAVVRDEAGTIMVKRYRLALPGEDAQ